MKSYKSRKLPYIEIEKNVIPRESPKKILLNSEKIKDTNGTPSRVPSCISTSQEYQIENNKFQKSKSSQKQNQSKNDFIIFKNYFNNSGNNNDMLKKSKDNKNNVKKTLSVDKIGKNNIIISENNSTKSFIEKNLYKRENAKNEINEIIQNFVENNLQNSKNCNFFRLFKMKRKNQNINKENENLFPPLYANYPPLETEQNIKDKNKSGNKYMNLLTKQNDDNNLHYRDALINSVNKNKLKENKIFIKIDEHFNKLKNDNSPKIIKKGFQGVIKNIKINNLNANLNNNTNNINNLINISSNGKSKRNNNNDMKDEITSKSNFKSITVEKSSDNGKYFQELNHISNVKVHYKTPSCEEKIKNLYYKKNKNRVKVKLGTPIRKNIYANQEEFELLKKNEKANINRKKTPNIIINNNLINNNNSKINKISFGNDINKIKNKKIEKVDDNIIGDSFREELNIIISDVNNCKKEIKNEIEIKDKKEDYSIEDCMDEVKLNLNFNDDSIEKNIPKEHEERIKLIKKYNRPETSYGNKKN
jgi:hypothetical protein